MCLSWRHSFSNRYGPLLPLHWMSNDTGRKVYYKMNNAKPNTNANIWLRVNSWRLGGGWRTEINYWITGKKEVGRQKSKGNKHRLLAEIVGRDGKGGNEDNSSPVGVHSPCNNLQGGHQLFTIPANFIPIYQ